MNSRRTVIIGVALVLAALAFLGNVYYLHNVEQNAYGNAKLVPVYVVDKAIAKGMPGADAISNKLVVQSEIPRKFLPGTAINKIDDISGMVAITALSPGQVVVSGMFVEPKLAQVTFAQRVHDNKVAVSISVDSVHAVAGNLMPGDVVDLLLSYKDLNGDDKVKYNRVMYQNVGILAIGNQAAPTADAASATPAAAAAAASAGGGSGLLTFEVPLDVAQRLIMASTLDGGSLYLVLVPPNNQPVSGPNLQTIDNSVGALFNHPLTPNN